MIWDIIQKKIENAGIASEADGNLFLDEMPGDVTIAVMMKSPLSGIRIDGYIPGYYTPTLQLIVRHTDPVEGLKIANRVIEVLKVETPELHVATADRGEVQINRFYPRELPIRYPRLDGGTIEWSINFLTSFTLPL